VIEYLCKELKLTITKDQQELTVTLTDDLSLNEIKVCYPITSLGKGHEESREYHLREALILSVRRLLDEAWKHNLIGSASKSLGESISLSTGNIPGQ
jgi:hypothetical protein